MMNLGSNNRDLTLTHPPYLSALSFRTTVVYPIEIVTVNPPEEWDSFFGRRGSFVLSAGRSRKKIF